MLTFVKDDIEDFQDDDDFCSDALPASTWSKAPLIRPGSMANSVLHSTPTLTPLKNSEAVIHPLVAQPPTTPTFSMKKLADSSTPGVKRNSFMQHLRKGPVSPVVVKTPTSTQPSTLILQSESLPAEPKQHISYSSDEFGDIPDELALAALEQVEASLHISPPDFQHSVRPVPFSVPLSLPPLQPQPMPSSSVSRLLTRPPTALFTPPPQINRAKSISVVNNADVVAVDQPHFDFSPPAKRLKTNSGSPVDPIVFPPEEEDPMPECDLEAVKTWVYPSTLSSNCNFLISTVNFPKRQYQFEITQQALMHNTLVVLPTGLGKTFVAAVVMYNFLRWFPKGITPSVCILPF